MCHSIYLTIFLIMIIGFVKCEDKFDDLKGNRSKRFFNNFNSYFLKSTENPTDVRKVEVVKAKSVINNISTDCSSSNDIKKQNCNVSDTKFERSLNDLVTYLTPPSILPKSNYSKYYDNSHAQIYFNGYEYPVENDNPNKPTTLQSNGHLYGVPTFSTESDPLQNGYHYKPPSIPVQSDPLQNGYGPPSTIPTQSDPLQNGYYYKPPSNIPVQSDPVQNGYYYKPPSIPTQSDPLQNGYHYKPPSTIPTQSDPLQNGYHYKPPSIPVQSDPLQNGYGPPSIIPTQSDPLQNGYHYKPPSTIPTQSDPLQNGYHYKPPSIPVQSDPLQSGYGPPSIIPTQSDPLQNGYHYKPPSTIPTQSDPLQNGYHYKPPSTSSTQSDPLQNGYHYKPPTTTESDSPQNGYHYKPPSMYLPPESDNLNVKIKEMMCIRSSRNGRFIVGMTTSKSIQVPPVIENRYSTENLPQCSVTTLDSNTFQINIQEPDMISCGVYYCDSNLETNLMCLMLRFPVIAGIKTGEDITMRIQCRPQPQVSSHVKQLKLKSSQINSNTGKSLPLFATVSGGNVNPELRSQVTLYALTKTGFTQPVTNNDIVEIGEDLQIRSTIREGDGWYYSRLGKVLVQKINSPLTTRYSYGNENTDSVIVLSDDGCINPKMKAICPLGPFNDPGNSLTSLLNLKMFVFDDMKDGDEIIMSVTVYGCVHYEDCFPDTNVCQEWQSSTRYKRSYKKWEDNITDSTSQITLRVQTSVRNKMINCNNMDCKISSKLFWEDKPILLLTAVFFSFVLVIYLTIKFKITTHNRHYTY